MSDPAKPGWEEARGNQEILEPPSTISFFRGPSLPFVFLRLCLYVALVEGISYALQWISRFALPAPRYSSLPNRLMVGESIDLLSALSAAWAMSRLEGRRFGEYGLPGRAAFGKLFWQGALFGLVEISSVLGVIAALGGYRFGQLPIHGGDLLRWSILWGAVFLAVCVYGEFAFRGYIQFTLAHGVGFWPAAIVLSLVFGVMHSTNPGESWVGLAGVVLAGVFLCVLRRRTRRLLVGGGCGRGFGFSGAFIPVSPVVAL